MPKTLLVVDDSPTIREAARLALTGEDWAVAGAEGPDEAVEAARGRPVDAVLLDAGVGGAELVRRLRALPGGGDLPVLLMGAAVTPAEAEAAGATAALAKPFGSDELAEALQAALDAQGFALDLTALDPAADEPLTLEELDGPLAAEGGRAAAAEVEIIDLSGGEDYEELELIDDLEPLELPPLSAAAEPVSLGLDDLFAAPAAAAPTFEPLAAEAEAASLFAAPAEPEPEPELELASAAEPPPIELPESEPLSDLDFLEPPAAAPPAEEPAGEEPAAAPGWDLSFTVPTPPPPLPAAAPGDALPPQLDLESLTPLIERVVERVAWEVVPRLAERLIREAIEKLQTEPPAS